MTTRRWLTFVEIDVSYCLNTYGVAPCTAAVGVTGSQKCFQTVGSCQDRPHYAESFVTLTFCMDSGYQSESGIEAIPSLVNVDVTPSRISLGEDLGGRPTVSCTFKDHRHSDTGPGFDKYLSTRTYNPFDQGWFFGKFAARHPNLRGKKLRVIQGYLGQTIAEMETRHYIIDSFDGPGLDGSFTITAKDPLKALDGDRAVAPAVNTGRLNADINSSQTSAALTPAGIGNTEYATSGYLNIGGTETVSFTRSGDTLTIGRAQKNSVGVAHSAGDRVQQCLAYTAADPANIIKDLEVTYGGLDTGYIPLSDWTTETAAYNGQVYTGFLTDPTPVKTLVAELIEQAGLAHWWDEVSETLRLQVLRAISTDAQTFDETNIVAGSLKITAQPDKRKSQIWTYYAQKNPLSGLDLDNLTGRAVEIDTDSEADYGSPLIKTITSRWIPTGGRVIAETLNQIQLGRYLKPPRKIEFAIVVAEGTVLPIAGAGYLLSAPPVQDVDGSRTVIPFTVISIKVKDGLCSVTGEELNWTELRPDPFNRVIAIDSNGYNQNWRDLHNSLYGSPQAGGTVTLQIASNARIGSGSVGYYALDTGDWSDKTAAFTATRSTISKTLTSISDTSAFVVGQAVTGTGIAANSRVVSKTSSTVTLDKFPTTNGTGSLTLWLVILKLINDGQIIGPGGQGGQGIHADNANGRAGNPGGHGLHVQAPILLTGTGTIDGGGGGGGGGAGDYAGFFGPFVDGSGGGGGAGDVGGNGGPPEGSGSSAGGAGSLNSGGGGGGSGFVGGSGGGPGANGGTGQANGNGNPGGPGGAAGYFIIGIGLVDYSGYTGAFRGNVA